MILHIRDEAYFFTSDFYFSIFSNKIYINIFMIHGFLTTIKKSVYIILFNEYYKTLYTMEYYL